VTTDFGGLEDGSSVAIQADGKIVVAGVSDNDFAVARYNSDGSLDNSFDGDGRVTTNFGVNGGGRSVALQADGKIVVSGFGGVIGNLDFAVARYNSDGSLDTTFGSDGRVTTDFGGNENGLSVVLQVDGKIVMAGWTDAGGDLDFAVARYALTAPEEITAVKQDALSVDENDNGEVNPGDTIQYTVTITNDGIETGFEVTFTDTLDPNTMLVAGSVTTTEGTVTTGNNAGDATVVVDVGTLIGGASVTITYEVTVNDPLPEDVTEVSNQFVVSGNNFEDITPDPTTSPVVPLCDNICNNRQGGVILLPEECFIEIGEFADSGEFVETLGLVVEVRRDEAPVTLTPPPNTPCEDFNWRVFDLGGEDITDEAGMVLGTNTGCFLFGLTGKRGYYHAEARCTDRRNQIYAFGILIN
jgi:uncharacterized delta-60 repeat protein/uncharacterized repeat protein (TIGR01451 family)